MGKYLSWFSEEENRTWNFSCVSRLLAIFFGHQSNPLTILTRIAFIDTYEDKIIPCMKFFKQHQQPDFVLVSFM